MAAAEGRHFRFQRATARVRQNCGPQRDSSVQRTYTLKSLATLIVFFKSSRKDAASDSVSIVGALKAAGFGFGEFIEGETKGFFLPVFKFLSITL